MILKPPQFNKLINQLLDAIPVDVMQMRDDVAKNFHSLLQASLSELDLVSREEFDAQVAVLQRTREKLEQLLAQLEPPEATQKAAQTTTD